MSRETLAEKAARLNTAQGIPADFPHPATPRPCYWHEDTDGTRYLIPGCMARVNDPDIDECTCPSLARQLEKARAEIAAMAKEKASLQGWHDAIVRAVYDHPEGVQIMAAAAKNATGEGPK